MSDAAASFGRTVQLFLVDGIPNGLMVASIHGWTGAVVVASQSTFARLLARPEVDRTGVYILYGPDPNNALGTRAYVGEADCVRERIDRSASERGFWETAVVVITSDEALTKGHIRYLEARLIEMTIAAGRVSLDNSQEPSADRKRLPESDRANMEAFLENLKIVLPTIGLDLLKPRPNITISRQIALEQQVSAPVGTPEQMNSGGQQFELRHRSGVVATAIEEDGEFIVLSGSRARKDSGSVSHSYRELKEELVAQGVLAKVAESEMFEFVRAYSFRSPSAAAAVVLDRSANGRLKWRTLKTKMTYHQWQESRSPLAKGGVSTILTY